MRVLILGGTGEARALAAELAGTESGAGIEFVSSLAGRVSNPALPVGVVRIGGFGGVDGLVAYLSAEGVDAVIDATHPFAATITGHAVAATGRLGVPLLVLRRPGWTAGAGDRWQRVPDIGAAAEALATVGAGTAFLTTGRRDLSVFADRFAAEPVRRFLVRTVDPPAGPVPPNLRLLLDRGPYTVAGERALMIEHQVGVLVTKDSGGPMTAAKLTAARELGLPVIVVDRPPVPDGPPVADSVAEAVRWLVARADR